MSSAAAKPEQLDPVTGQNFVDERAATWERRQELALLGRDTDPQQLRLVGAGLLDEHSSRRLGLGAKVVNAAIAVGVCVWAVALLSIWGALGGAAN